MNKPNAINIFQNDNEAEILPNDKSLQCIIMEPPMYLELKAFSIEDENKRRRLIRAIFGWIIFQNIIYVPVMYLFVKHMHNIPDLKCKEYLNMAMWFIKLSIYAILYRLRNIRRKSPYKYLSLILVTFLNGLHMGIIAFVDNSLLIIVQPIVIILELLVIILYTLQSRFKLTNFLAVLLVSIIFVACIMANLFIFHIFIIYGMVAYSLLTAFYIIFDTHLILRSPLHSYQMKENEHVFGTVNIYADLPKLFWLFFKNCFLDTIILYVRNCFSTLKLRLY